MKSDYLWDKTGSDADVESLELSLSGLAYDGDPPVLPLRRAPTPVPLAPVKLPTRRGSMFRHAKLGPIALAAGLMLMGFAVAFSALQKEMADVRRGWNLVPVTVASVDMAEGTVVTVDMLSQRSIPEQFVTSSVVKPDSVNYVVGQRVQVAVAAGDPLQWSQFDSARAVEHLASRIMMKARALAVRVTGTAAVGGWIRPNDHVDIIGSFKDPVTNEQVAVTLLQNVNVIATGKITGTTNVNLVPEAQRTYDNVSLMVLPEEAEILVLAQESGNLTFSLRNEEDLDVLEERGRATINTLLSGERTKVLQQKRFNTIQVIRGASVPTPGK